ncbi:MAG TPA: carboxypeptidase regulatory-like domain-containing protein, partial [Terriglobia bacterium]|nr:carboxypeptidase regulatory-like domain-containing protein [Terriglobia bacterium]
MRRFTWGVSIGVGLCLLCGVAPARGQQSKGSYTGTVTDVSGGVVPKAKVTATEQGTGFSYSAETSSDGSYTLPLLPPGRYTITAIKQGFSEFSEGPLTLTVNQQAKVDIQLKVGAASTMVQVEASAPLLDTQTYSVGTTIEQAKVQQLPFNGRHFLEATLFTPGVVPGTQGSELNDNRGGSINVNGLRETMNTFLLDGMSDTSIAVGTYSATPPLDSIQEFRLETGVYDAKFGNSAGAQVNIVTKSGTNHYHGTLYEYLRNSALDARNYFEPTVPGFQRNQFGASVGGPLSIPHVYDGHDKTFFFVNYEGLRDLHSFFSRAHVPSLAERSGDFSADYNPLTASGTLLLDPLVLFNPAAPLTVPNNDVRTLASSFPTGTLDPVGEGLVNLYPKPNISGPENFTEVVRRKVYTNNYVGRFDHRWGANDTAFYRFNLTTDAEFAPSGLPTGIPGYGTYRDDWFIATGIDWSHIFSPTLVNEAKVDYNRWQYRWTTQDQGNPISAQLGLKNLLSAARDIGVPNLGFSGFDGFGSDTSFPQAGAVNTFEYGDTLSQVHGNHSLDYGLQFRQIKRGNFYEDIQARGNYSFSGQVTGGAVFAALPPDAQQGLLQACPPTTCNFGNGVADALFGIPTSWVNG